MIAFQNTLFFFVAASTTTLLFLGEADAASMTDLTTRCLPEDPTVCVGMTGMSTPSPSFINGVVQYSGGYGWSYTFVQGLEEGTSNDWATVNEHKTGLVVGVSLDKDKTTCGVEVNGEMCNWCSTDGCDIDENGTPSIQYDCTNIQDGRAFRSNVCEEFRPILYPFAQYHNEFNSGPYPCRTDVWHRGEDLAAYSPIESPNGQEWQWWECAAQCRAHSDCDFYVLQLLGNKQCILKKNQGEPVPAANNGHAEGDKYGKCLVDPPYDCGYDGWHSGDYLRTFDASEAPNGFEWQGYECAEACRADGECEFYTLQLDQDKKCILLKNQGDFNEVPEHAHMEGNQFNQCIRDKGPKKVCTGHIWGDPHLLTFDGLKFDAQPKGEAVFLMDETSPFGIHGRLTQALARYPLPAVTTGVAIHGKDVNQPNIQLSMATPGGDASAVITTPGGHSCPIELYVDCMMQDSISYQSIGVIVESEGSQITVEYPGLLSVTFYVRMYGTCHFSMDVNLLDCEAAKDTVRGLLGSPNGDKSDDWMDRDGNAYNLPQGARAFFLEPAFDYTKQNWMVTDERDSIFCNDDDFEVPDEEYDDEIEELIEDPDDCVVEICGDDIGCRIEGVTLGCDAAEEYMQQQPPDEETDDDLVCGE